MADFPFQLLIKNTSSDKLTESLTCTSLLRAIVNRREVYDALWNDQPVIVKTFSHKIFAKRHLKREWQGFKLLQNRGLNSPKPLFWGQAGSGRWAVVVEKICNSSVVVDVFDQTTEKAKKLELLILVCKEVAKQHNKGVLQRDLHLGNFLLTGDKVFALDPGQIRFSSRPITRKTGISQLAVLAGCLPETDTDSIAELCNQYARARDWQFEESDKLLFQKYLAWHKKRGIRRALRKSLRTSKRQLRIRADGYVTVFDRSFCRGAQPLDFIRDIDSLMGNGEILKNGNTCYVSRLSWNGSEVVVKRYNHKSFMYSLRNTLMRSRARRGWLHGHQLRMLSIPTPKPLAFIEMLKGPVVWKSYLVTEYVQAQNLYYFLHDNKTTLQQRSKVDEQIKALLDKLAKYRITHGDLKHTNILITNDGPVLTDLDGMKVHKWDWVCNIRREKDIARFTKPLGERTAIEGFRTSRSK